MSVVVVADTCCPSQCRVVCVSAIKIIAVHAYTTVGLRAGILLVCMIVRCEGQFGAYGGLIAAANDLTDGDCEHSVHIYRFNDANDDINICRRLTRNMCCNRFSTLPADEVAKHITGG